MLEKSWLFAVIILNYNNYLDTIRCIECLNQDENIIIIVVDNCSSNDSADRLLDFCQNIDNCFFIEAKTNRGYAAGNNIGIKFVIDEIQTDYICILNNDTLPDVKELLKLRNYLEENFECALVGPVLLEDREGQVVQSAGARINLWKGDVSPFCHGEHYDSSVPAHECGYIGGACMMFRTKDIAQLGYIPENYFLFFEETEWCLKAKRLGKKVICLPSASIIHKGSASVSAQGNLSSYLLVRNAVVFEKRNASLLQLIYFMAYKTLKCLARRIIKNKKCLWELSALRDGLMGTTREEYSFILCEGED